MAYLSFSPERHRLLIITSLMVFLLSVAHCTYIKAQSISDTTFRIPEVVINASRLQYFRDDIKTDAFNSEYLKPYEGESLGHFLFENTALNVKYYGTGGAMSSISLRGSSSNQVQVNWNGFPINSVTQGSYDFSMIPAAGFDKVSVVYGAPGALYGSGTFGGAINLDNNLQPNKVLSISANIGYESLRTLEGSASISVGNNTVAWKGNLWGTVSDNEFTYYDYIRQSKRKQNDGQWHDAGTIQQIVFRLSPTSTLETGLWYQVKYYHIPSKVGSVSYESQLDSTLKIFIAYKKSVNRWGLQLKAAAFNDYERYTQKSSERASEYSLDSRIRSHQFFGDADFRYFVNPEISVDAGIVGSYIVADVSAYGRTKYENGVTAFAGIKYDVDRLSVQTEIRKEWNSDFHSSVLPSLGMAWKAIPDKWIFRINISQKFRKPTFNDMFWKPGGNTDLKPESGFSAEAGSAVTLIKSSKIKLSADLGIYFSKINDMIVWQPAGAYWSAENYQHVNSVGTDGSLLFEMTSRRVKYNSSLKVMLNKSDAEAYSGEHVKMLYSPRIITTWENRVSFGIADLTISHHFTADRFYDENSLLKPYQTVDMQAGVRVPAGKGKIGVHFSVSNLTNTTYELIRLYPMPDRFWSMKINYSY